MRLRSLLFVPGDRPERIEKALGLGADALILDLEDSVVPAAKENARRAVAEALARPLRTVPLFVRINPLDSGMLSEDVMAARGADALILPKAEGAESVRALDAVSGGVALILPIASETAAAVFQLGHYAEVADRLVGLTWGAEDLPAAIGASTSREPDGRFTPPYEMVRALTLFGAHAAGVSAIDTVFPAFKDLDGLATYAERAARDGFNGMMAIHPSQVPVINAAFTPTPEAVAHARAVVAAFEAKPGVGALQLEGKMIDAPHLKQARRVIALLDASSTGEDELR
ncbi:HpcH/HpaI aldolase/citrate lyase family protein [Stakelama pacifica]|uniref:Citrate lyase subunit beta/citryl-CoA lyase n=1 Tax=Stakelama pacifica TaxID=517720 RepID=A0A4R6FCB8_9SPHN|nr:CoA ester lyase [Stakelama pacifica]TDN78250.1 citrate lyase subunit beta/citryl-CoA lyase [Stakelama pacifica]GGO99806.1 citryl-CoA lyase [Stakelama pacifica]